MPYNRDLHAEAPLPSGPPPTDDEVMATIHRGRRLQSEALLQGLRTLFGGERPATAAMPLGIRRSRSGTCSTGSASTSRR